MADINDVSDLLCCITPSVLASCDKEQLLNDMCDTHNGIVSGLMIMGRLLENNTQAGFSKTDIADIGRYMESTAVLLSSLHAGISELTHKTRT
ncbi:hypothetical protein ACRPLT_004402 [Citrobacter freundii]